jgi:hypothetical protein
MSDDEFIYEGPADRIADTAATDQHAAFRRDLLAANGLELVEEPETLDPTVVAAATGEGLLDALLSHAVPACAQGAVYALVASPAPGGGIAYELVVARRVESVVEKDSQLS